MDRGQFALCLAAFMLSGGLLGDRLGRKRTYLAAVVVFVAGSVVCAAKTGIEVLVAGRVVQGLAAAVIVPGALSLIGRSTTDPAVRGRRMGLWGMVASVAVVAGPLVGGALVDNAGWPWIFLANVPLGAAIVVTGLAGLTESADPAHASFDPAAQLLAVVALGSLAYGAIEARDLTAHATATVLCGFVFVVSVLGFILAERRVARPVVPLSLFRSAQFSVVNAASVALGFGANGAFFLVTLYLQVGGPVDRRRRHATELVLGDNSTAFVTQIQGLGPHVGRPLDDPQSRAVLSVQGCRIEVQVEIDVVRDVGLRIEVMAAVVHLDLGERQQGRRQPRGQRQLDLSVDQGRDPRSLPSFHANGRAGRATGWPRAVEREFVRRAAVSVDHRLAEGVAIGRHRSPPDALRDAVGEEAATTELAMQRSVASQVTSRPAWDFSTNATDGGHPETGDRHQGLPNTFSQPTEKV